MTDLPYGKTDAPAASPPSSWVEMAAETMAAMLSNGAKLPLLVQQGHDGRVVITELERHPSRWNAAEWERFDRANDADVLKQLAEGK